MKSWKRFVKAGGEKYELKEEFVLFTGCRVDTKFETQDGLQMFRPFVEKLLQLILVLDGKSRKLSAYCTHYCTPALKLANRPPKKQRFEPVLKLVTAGSSFALLLDAIFTFSLHLSDFFSLGKWNMKFTAYFSEIQQIFVGSISIQDGMTMQDYFSKRAESVDRRKQDHSQNV